MILLQMLPLLTLLLLASLLLYSRSPFCGLCFYRFWRQALVGVPALVFVPAVVDVPVVVLAPAVVDIPVVVGVPAVVVVPAVVFAPAVVEVHAVDGVPAVAELSAIDDDHDLAVLLKNIIFFDYRTTEPRLSG
jgi:hypothetical protein